MEDIGLAAFDIDLEEVDLVELMFRAELCEGYDRRGDGAIAYAEFLRLLCDRLDCGGESVQPVDHMEVDHAVVATDEAAHCGVARAQPRVQAGEVSLRLDHNTAPSSLVEPERHVVGDRVPGAHIDIGAGLLAREREREMIILEVLRV